METERCPVCGQDVTMMPAFQAHLRTVRSDEAHVAALYSLLGIDYAAMRAEDRAHAEELARAAGRRCAPTSVTTAQRQLVTPLRRRTPGSYGDRV
jgi:hypothetical protein